jgi:hypothetical protein
LDFALLLLAAGASGTAMAADEEGGPSDAGMGADDARETTGAAAGAATPLDLEAVLEVAAGTAVSGPVAAKDAGVASSTAICPPCFNGTTLHEDQGTSGLKKGTVFGTAISS